MYGREKPEGALLSTHRFGGGGIRRQSASATATLETFLVLLPAREISASFRACARWRGPATTCDRESVRGVVCKHTHLGSTRRTKRGLNGACCLRILVWRAKLVFDGAFKKKKCLGDSSSSSSRLLLVLQKTSKQQVRYSALNTASRLP